MGLSWGYIGYMMVIPVFFGFADDLLNFRILAIPLRLGNL
jgi:hypothetical protein